MSDDVVVSPESETSSDIPADTTTTATIAVGDTISGQVETPGDRDWFAVELEAGHTYTIDLRGRRTDDGTLYDPYLRGIHDDGGVLVRDPKTTDDNDGDGPNSHLVFKAPRSGTYYIAAGAWGDYLGTYELEVWDTSADDTRGGARELGDITGLDGARFPRNRLDGDGDRVDYYRFTLSETKTVSLGLRRQDADADLYLEDAAGRALASSVETGTSSERVDATLAAGTYYVRVESRDTGANDYIFRYGVSAAEPGAQVLRASGPPAFGEESYAFELAENADGSVTRVSLGTVAAEDPDGDTVGYAIVGGNEEALFVIDASSGELYYVGSGEDHEGGDGPYALTVRATAGTDTVDTAVTVTVTDEAEAPAFGETSYAFELAENADGSVTRVSLGTVAAKDQDDGDTVGYAIVGGNEEALFAIDASSGELYYVGSGEDYESETKRYELTVRAGDGTHTVDATVTVTVTDEAEAPAFGETSYAFELTENVDGSTDRVSLGAVSATDPDEDTVSYAIAAGNELGRFTIDASSGELYYVGPGRTTRARRSATS